MNSTPALPTATAAAFSCAEAGGGCGFVSAAPVPTSGAALYAGEVFAGSGIILTPTLSAAAAPTLSRAEDATSSRLGIGAPGEDTLSVVVLSSLEFFATASGPGDGVAAAVAVLALLWHGPVSVEGATAVRAGCAGCRTTASGSGCYFRRWAVKAGL